MNGITEIELDSKLKTHTVKRENIMIQRENKSPRMTTERFWSRSNEFN